MVVELEY